jgi:hypothetical protein
VRRPIANSRLGASESLPQLLEHRERSQQGSPLARIELEELSRERTVALGADPLEQVSTLAGRLHATHAPVRIVGQPPDQSCHFELGDETREHRRVEPGEARKVRQADWPPAFGGEKDVNLGRRQRAGGRSGPQSPGQPRDGNTKARRAQLCSRDGLSPPVAWSQIPNGHTPSPYLLASKHYMGDSTSIRSPQRAARACL